MDGKYQRKKEMKDNCFLNVYSEDRRDRYRPRSVFIDLDNTIINRTKKEFKDLYHHESFVSGTEDASDMFARGMYTVGRYALENTLETIRRQAENCDALQGF